MTNNSNAGLAGSTRSVCSCSCSHKANLITYHRHRGLRPPHATSTFSSPLPPPTPRLPFQPHPRSSHHPPPHNDPNPTPTTQRSPIPPRPPQCPSSSLSPPLHDSAADSTHNAYLLLPAPARVDGRRTSVCSGGILPLYSVAPAVRSRGEVGC